MSLSEDWPWAAIVVMLSAVYVFYNLVKGEDEPMPEQEEEDEYNVGDVVWLKSGSPAMCVEDGGAVDDQIDVVWSPKDGGDMLRDQLDGRMLTKQRTEFVSPVRRAFEDQSRKSYAPD